VNRSHVQLEFQWGHCIAQTPCLVLKINGKKLFFGICAKEDTTELGSNYGI